jgi:hypothetical protein
MGTLKENSTWRIRSLGDDLYNYENISDDDKDCLGVTNYLSIAGSVSKAYTTAGKFESSTKPVLSTIAFTTDLWSLEGGVKHYLSARADCSEGSYNFKTEEDDSTKWNFIASIAYDGNYVIQNA